MESAPVNWRQLALRGVLGAVVGAVLVTTYVLCFVPRTYTAGATLLFPLPPAAESLSAIETIVGGGTMVPQGSDFPLTSYLAVLTSEAACRQVAAACRVREIYGLETDRKAVELVRKAVRVKLQPDRTIQISATVPGTPSIRSPGEVLHRAAAGARDKPYRELCAQLIDSLVAEMGKIADDIKLDRTKAEMDAVRQRLETTKRELEAALARQADLRERAGKLPDSQYAQQLLSQMAQIQTRKTEVDAQVNALATRLEALRQQAAREARESEKQRPTAPLLQEQARVVRDALAEYERVSEMYGPESPQVLTAKQALEEARRRLKEQAAASQAGQTEQIQSVETDYRAALATQSEFATRARQLEQELRTLPSELLDAEMLQAEIDAKQKLVAEFSALLIKAEVAYEKRGIRWFLLDPPRPPEYKTSPSGMKALLLGGVLGFVLALLPLLYSLFGRLVEPAPADG